MNDDAFPVTARNRVKRLHERARYDREAVYAVLDAGMLCHVSYVIDGQPYCTPTLYWREGDHLYWHGSSASRMLRSLEVGAPVCLAVTHLDGLVLARCGFNHSANYRSAMCFGVARLVDDPDRKNQAMLDVVDRFYPGRSAELRQTNAQEAKATKVVGMRIEEASVKSRAKGVGDDPEDLGHAAWAGVIPLHVAIGVDQPSEHLLPGTARSPSIRGYQPGRRLDDALLEAQRLYEAGCDR